MLNPRSSGGVRQLARWLRHLPDRFLHGSRRRAAWRIAARDVRRVLVVCHGNICRSPYAEVALRRQLSEARGKIAVRSAGFIGPDRAPPEDAVAAAADRGHDLASHRSRVLTAGDLVPGTLVVVMNVQQRAAVRTHAPAGVEVALLGDFDPLSIQRRAIADPVEQPRAAFDEVYDRIDRCTGQLAAALTRAGPRP